MSISAKTVKAGSEPVEAALFLEGDASPARQGLPLSMRPMPSPQDLNSRPVLCQLTAAPQTLVDVERMEGTELELRLIPLRSDYDTVRVRSIVEYPSTKIDISLAKTVPDPPSFRIRVVDASSWTPLACWTALLCDDDYGGLEVVDAEFCTYLPKHRSAILGMVRSQSGEDVTMAYADRSGFLVVVPDGSHALAITPMPDRDQGTVTVAVQSGHEVVMRAAPDVVQPIWMTITLATELNKTHDPSGVGTYFFPAQLFASSVTPEEGRFPSVPFGTAFGFIAPDDCRNPVDCRDRTCHMDHVTCKQWLDVLRAARVQFRGWLGSSDVSMEGVVWCLPTSGPEAGALFDPGDPAALCFDWARLGRDDFDCLKSGEYWIGPGYGLDEPGEAGRDAPRGACFARMGSRLSVVPNDSAAIVHVPIVAGHYVRGSIVDPAGSPLSSKRVFVRMPGYAGRVSATTNAEGAFAFGPLPAGSLEFYLEGPPSADNKLVYLGSAVSPSEALALTVR